jgi:hypothetical protein
MTININHERYGESTFATLEEAQSAIRACGPEFADTTLRVNALLCVIDERDEEIGNQTIDANEYVRLADVATSHIWFTSVGQPSGCDLIADDDEELCIPDGWDDLTGTVADNQWTWDGFGKPTDFNANTVQRIVAFV